MKRRWWTAAAAAMMLIPAMGRAQEGTARLTFEVATIKPADAGEVNGGIKPLPGGDGYVTQNVPMRLMISLMYEVPMRQIKGGPGWLDTDRWDIQAKADHSYSKDELHSMFQHLLEDRFNLKFHREIKDGPVYLLMVDKAGLKMTANPGEQDYKIPLVPDGEGGFIGKRVPLKYLCWFLGQQVQRDERPVIDRTALAGTYDFTLKFAPERAVDASKDAGLPELPSIFDALKEQLGLRLEQGKGPVETFVVDHVDPPSDN